MKDSIKKWIRRLLYIIHQQKLNKFYHLVMHKNQIANKTVIGEKQWRAKWSMGGVKPNPCYYRVFAHYIGENLNIVPEDISHDIIEPLLNPVRYTEFYSDKNIFDKLFPEGYFPKTVFRRMNGVFYTANYDRIEWSKQTLNEILNRQSIDRLIVKPSVDGGSGRGVMMLMRSEGCQWKEYSNGVDADFDFFSQLGKDYIVQEAIEQSAYISQFNPTSVNTIRMSIYKSVKTDECHLTGAIMRIGGKGSIMDNAHAGGFYVGIKEDGTLCNKVFNQYGEHCTKFNDIDFMQSYRIPNWGSVVEFGKSIGKYYPHCRLLALDVVLDRSNEPKLIEVNVKYYSSWLFQYTQDAAFGSYTEEILRYCRNYYKELENVLYL